MGNGCGTIMARQANTTTHHTTLHRLFRKDVATMKTYTITYAVRANGDWVFTHATVDKAAFYAAYLGYRRNGFVYTAQFTYRGEWRNEYGGEKYATGEVTLVRDNMVFDFKVRESVKYDK